MSIITSTTKAGGDTVTSANNNAQRLDTIQAGGDYATSTGTTNAYVLALDAQIVAYTTGAIYKFKANFTNTGNATLNVNAIGVKTIKKQNGENLSPNDIISGDIVIVVYDGTNLQIVSQMPRSAPIIDRVWTASETISANNPVSSTSVADQIEKTRKQSWQNPGASAGLATGAAVLRISGCSINSSKFAIIYADGTDVKICLAAINAETLVITWGSAQTVQSASTAKGGGGVDVILADTDKVFCIYNTADQKVKVRAGTVSGTVVTFGTEVNVVTLTDAAMISADLLATDTIACMATDAGANIHMFGCSLAGTVITSGWASRVTQADYTGASGGDHDADCVFIGSATTVTVYKRVAAVNAWKVTWVGTTPTSVSVSAIDGVGTGDRMYGARTTSSSSAAFFTWRETGANTTRANTADTSLAFGGQFVVDTSGPAQIGIGGLRFMNRVASARFVYIQREGATTESDYAELTTEKAVDSDNDWDDIGNAVGATCVIGINDATAKHIRMECPQGAGNISARCYEEYDNTDRFEGFAVNGGNATDPILVRHKGKLAGFAGLTIGNYAWMNYLSQTIQNSAFLSTLFGSTFGIVTDTDEIDINYPSANSCAKVRLRPIETTSQASGTYRMYHNLGRIPRIIEVQAGKGVSGYAGMSVGYYGPESSNTGTIAWGSDDANRAGADNSENMYETTNKVIDLNGSAFCTATVSTVTKYYIDFNFTLSANHGNIYAHCKLT